MAFKVFFDANIILDHTLKREGFDNTRELFLQSITGKISAFTSPSIIHIIGYWLTKAYGNEEAREIILTLLIDVHVLELDHTITIAALHSNITDIEDALQYHTALHHDMDVFVSRDSLLKKSASNMLPVLTPEELLKRLR